MPWHVALATTLVAFLADAVKGLVGRVLVALGIGAVTAVGFSTVINQALANMSLGNLGQLTIALNAVGVPWFVGTIISAVTTRLTLRGLMSDNVTFWLMRKSL